MNIEDIMKREIFEMQKCMQNLMKRQKELSDTIYDLSYKVKLLGGDPRQQELKF
jgi:MinD-like ATPase involved in chromosome partitioning or flagellar assembly